MVVIPLSSGDRLGVSVTYSAVSISFANAFYVGGDSLVAASMSLISVSTEMSSLGFDVSILEALTME